MKKSEIDLYVELREVKIPHLTEVMQNLAKEKTAHQESAKTVEIALIKSLGKDAATRLYSGKDGWMVVVSKDRVKVLKEEDFEQE